MTARDVLRTTIGLLDHAGVPFMVTGSQASSYHGEPRATLDLDLVIDPDPSGLARLVDGLIDAGFYVDADTARLALAERGQFNAIGRDGWKVDFIIRKDRPFSRAEFGRRLRANLLGTAGYIATVEDMIIAKLEWAAASDSDRQLRDVEGMLEVSRDQVDHAYLARWIHALGLDAAWERVSGD